MIINLPKDTVNNGKNEYKHHSKVLGDIEKNKKKARKILNANTYDVKGIFSNNDYDKMFSIAGALKVKGINELRFPAFKFITLVEGRYFTKGFGDNIEIHLRGPRYVTAIDPHLSVVQKLDILRTDIYDACYFLKQYEINTEQYLSISTILDYLKNALITLFNSFIHQEKLGILKQNDKEYQSYRRKLVELVQCAVISYYLSLCDKFEKKHQDTLTNNLSDTFIKQIIDSIIRDFRNFTFSSKSLVRPEATHPLVLLSYAINLIHKFNKFDFIFGMPSGSTEISCLIHQLSIYLKKATEIETKLILVPISIHSIKDTGVQLRGINHLNFNKMFAHFNCANDYCKTLIVDDNSASGRTMEKISNMVKKHLKNSEIICSVVEADLIRIAFNLKKNDDNLFFCHPSLYKYSTNVLPISKIISPKYDLKEVFERNCLLDYYKSRKKSNLTEQIIDEVIADSIEHRMEEHIDSYNELNSIQRFKHTHFSNFYAVNFTYKGRKYSSVEQAYLRQKFCDNLLKKLTSQQREELNEVLKMKGISDEKSDFSTAFYDFLLPSGVLKRWSYKLKEWGLEDKDWDSKRLRIMTELLLLKYSNSFFMKKLLETGNLYLIEGNDWNDTFWGVCNERGKNYLGRLLMNIRSKILSGRIDIEQMRNIIG
jgi:predicted NAD-dependent protein-ADP-ribosyltransferase YbiA (DUF1768 family)